MSCTTRHIVLYFKYTHSNVRGFVYIHISFTINCSRLKGGGGGGLHISFTINCFRLKGGYPWLLIVKEDPHVNCAVFWKKPQNQGHVSQQVWHDKDPFLFKGAAHEAKIYTVTSIPEIFSNRTFNNRDRFFESWLNITQWLS